MSLRACTEANDMKLAGTRAAEDEIFDQWVLGKSPQQAETENPPSGGVFCFDAFLIKKALLAKEALNYELSPQNASSAKKLGKLLAIKKINIGERKVFCLLASRVLV